MRLSRRTPRPAGVGKLAQCQIRLNSCAIPISALAYRQYARVAALAAFGRRLGSAPGDRRVFRISKSHLGDSTIEASRERPVGNRGLLDDCARVAARKSRSNGTCNRALRMRLGREIR